MRAGSSPGSIRFTLRPPPGLDRLRLVSVLKARTQGEWFAAMLRRQARHGELPDSAMHYAIADLYAALGRSAA